MSYSPSSYSPPYTVLSQMYFGSFPKEWALSHIDGTGPNKCLNCYSYGMISDCFAFYCVNCAALYERYHRGYGVIDSFLETANISNYLIEKSAYNTYLQNINFLNLVTIKDIAKYHQSLSSNSGKVNFELSYDVLYRMLEDNSYSTAMLDEYELYNINYPDMNATYSDADDEDDISYDEYILSKQMNNIGL